MITELNRLIELVETHLSEDLDVAGLARTLGTTEYHLRRMFSSLTSMPLSEYVRRRRMTVAAAEVIVGAPLLDVAVKFGYGSTEAFTRAFRSVHGAVPGDVRRDGGPLRSQPQLRLRLTVEGNTTMDTRITDRPAFCLVGHAARVPLVHRGANPHIEAHIASLPAGEHERLKALGNTEPAGMLQISDEHRLRLSSVSSPTLPSMARVRGSVTTTPRKQPIRRTRSRFLRPSSAPTTWMTLRSVSCVVTTLPRFDTSRTIR